MILPDAELAVITYLRTKLPSARIYTEIPASATFPLVKITRFGGIPLAMVTLDPSSIQTEVYGTTKAEARLLAAQAQSAYSEADGWETTGVYITAARPLSGLLWLPDPDFSPPKPRYLFDTSVYLRNR